MTPRSHLYVGLLTGTLPLVLLANGLNVNHIGLKIWAEKVKLSPLKRDQWQAAGCRAVTTMTVHRSRRKPLVRHHRIQEDLVGMSTSLPAPPHREHGFVSTHRYRRAKAAPAVAVVLMMIILGSAAAPRCTDACWTLLLPAPRLTSEGRTLRRQNFSFQKSLRLTVFPRTRRKNGRITTTAILAEAKEDSNNHDLDQEDPVSGWGLVPPSFQRKPEGKDSLYSSNELMQLLDLHTKLAETTFAETVVATSSNSTDASRAPVDDGSASFRSLHDMVVQATVTADSLASSESSTTIVLAPEIRQRLQQTSIIATDVDATLLRSGSSGMHPRTCQALRRALRAVRNPTHPLLHLCLATGKTRTGALQSLRRADPKLGRDLENVPGVFVQGLYCVDGRTGRVLYDQRLEESAALAVERLVTDNPAVRETSTLFCYRCDDIYYTPTWSQPHHVRELHDVWGEPEPIAVESITALLATSTDDASGEDNRCHKLLIMDSDTNRLATMIRPAAEEIARRHGCVVTQAIPTMIELLPPNCSKAVGVRQLCSVLGIPSTDDTTIPGLVAIGDAENDVEMLQMASVGFAVGNAVPEAKRAADVTLDETNNDGGAGAAIELVLEHLEPTKKSPGTFIIS